MASVLITTSRRTSNRVRTFIKDLHYILPDSDRFNRGSLSRAEIVSRINQTGANAAFIVSLYQGNPGGIEVINKDGNTHCEIRLESVLLRREIQNGSPSRINSSILFAVKKESSVGTVKLAELITSIMESDLKYLENPSELKTEDKVLHWFEDVTKGRTLWTTYAISSGREFGPRLRMYELKGQ